MRVNLTLESPEVKPVIDLLDTLPSTKIPGDWPWADPERKRAELLPDGDSTVLTKREMDLVEAIDYLITLLCELPPGRPTAGPPWPPA